jgi:hypothetical protein
LRPDEKDHVIEEPYHKLRVRTGRLFGDGNTAFEFGLGFRIALEDDMDLSQPIQADGDAVVV